MFHSLFFCAFFLERRACIFAVTARAVLLFVIFGFSLSLLPCGGTDRLHLPDCLQLICFGCQVTLTHAKLVADLGVVRSRMEELEAQEEPHAADLAALKARWLHILHHPRILFRVSTSIRRLPTPANCAPAVHIPQTRAAGEKDRLRGI